MLLLYNYMYGQQLPIYSQYLYNKFLINPAVAGADGYTSINLTAREQWVGYAGAPQTFSVSAQGRILKKGYSIKHDRNNRSVFKPGTDGRIGLGGSIYSDKNGLLQRTGFQASYVYHMWLQSKTQLSFGLSLNAFQLKLNEKEIALEDPTDPILYSDLRKGIFVPDLTFGAYLLNSRYNVGFSADQLLESAAKTTNSGYEGFRMKRQYYLFGTYDFDAGSNSVIQPSMLFMMSEQLKPMADIGVTYIMKQEFWTGLTYRTSGAVIAILGFRYDNFNFGYSFDFTLSEIQKLTYGTHELTIAMKFGDSSRKYRWLDRY
jgi:type IX secretion system PorP/SprF family membrane protein